MKQQSEANGEEISLASNAQSSSTDSAEEPKQRRLPILRVY